VKNTTYTRLYHHSHAAIKLEAVKRGVTMPDVIEALVAKAGLEVPAEPTRVVVRNDVDTQGA